MNGSSLRTTARNLVIAGASFGLLHVGGGPTGASLYVDIAAWLNPDQTLEALTNRSAAIVVAEYRGRITRRVDPQPTPLGVTSGLEAVAILDSVQWLKGRGSPGALEVLYDEGSNPTFLPLEPGELRIGRRVMAFLSPYRKILPPSSTGSGPRSISVHRGHRLDHVSARVQELLRPAFRAGSDTLVSRIAVFVLREDLEDQFRGADLVAVAELTDSVRVCGPGRCQRVVVQERIKGDPGAGAIWVESARAGRPRQRVLLFATPNSRGEWAGSGGFGGIRSLREGTVEGTTRSLAEVIEQLGSSRMSR